MENSKSVQRARQRIVVAAALGSVLLGTLFLASIYWLTRHSFVNSPDTERPAVTSQQSEASDGFPPPVDASPDQEVASVEQTELSEKAGGLEDVKASPPVYVELSPEIAIDDLSIQVPEAINKKLEGDDYQAWGDATIGRAGLNIRPRPGYPVNGLTVPPTFLSPFLRLDPIEGQSFWQFRLIETAPLTYIASDQNPRSRDEIVIVVEQNHYEDVAQFNLYYWLEKIKGIRSEGHRSVFFSAMEPIDDSGTRFQFSVTGGVNRHVAFLLIHDQDRVFVLHAVSRSRETLTKLHRQIANSTVLEIPRPGNVPESIQDEIRGQLDQMIALAEADQVEELIKLIASDFRYSLLIKEPEKFRGFVEMIREENKRLIPELKRFDFSKAIYNQYINQLVYPSDGGQSLHLEKEGDRWRML